MDCSFRLCWPTGYVSLIAEGPAIAKEYVPIQAARPVARRQNRRVHNGITAPPQATPAANRASSSHCEHMLCTYVSMHALMLPTSYRFFPLFLTSAVIPGLGEGVRSNNAEGSEGAHQ